MGNRLYVGNLSFNTTESELRELFAKCGEVVSAEVITDRMTGRARGFGFVQMATEADAKKAIAELHGKQLDGRSLTVNEARDRSGGGGGFNGGRRGGRSGGGGSRRGPKGDRW